MTAEPVRHTQFASWIDEDAWMEDMKGPRWTRLLDEEEALADSVTKKPAVQSRFRRFQCSYRSAASKQMATKPFELAKGAIQIQWHSDFYKTVWFKQDPDTTRLVRDITADSTGSHMYVTIDTTEGAEQFALSCFSPKKKSPVWSIPSVGPDVARIDQRLFYLSVEKKLVYHQLWTCSLNGTEKKKLFEVSNLEVNLSLEKHSDGRVYLVADHSQVKQFYRLSEDGTLTLDTHVFTPPNDWILPIAHEYSVLFLWPSQGLMVTQRHGEKKLWKCSSTKQPKCLLTLPAGVIHIDPFVAHEAPPSGECVIDVVHPAQGHCQYTYSREKGLQQTSPMLPTGITGQRISATSFDTTDVHGYIAHMADSTPRNLLMIGYGAYGIPTGVGSFQQRWAPLLESGWAIAVGFLRGGGDHTDAWGRAGQREGREKTFQDFYTLIRKCQRMFGIPAARTIIYGRSAGGLLVGGTLGKFPGGSLMGGVYTEVPYVDVLRTTTNQDLPLTILEYDEFGNPAMRLSDFLSVGLMSPADSAALIETPNVFVLARTAANDSQVFAYEPLKWIRRLRRNAPKGAPKLCLVDRHGGHFTTPDAQLDQWSLDCALIDAWTAGDLEDSR